ncbi:MULTISPECIES: carbohydrate ABC transporter permease [unclassified Brachybacterium]|uniref:carbohydrate ABC transporter permease n=1 Tax=unclassified Brachybacterium TaxID=2623841 RepID=UPI000C80F2DF|nr:MULTISPECIES: carbohydrate ABC transporter permease [unclassified Brachybacterium]PMC74516.1 sugar ABC transporter permease [Brachybacterium sp. UMB0905]
MATTSALSSTPPAAVGAEAAPRRRRSERRFQSPADVIVFILLCLGAFTMLLPLAWMLSTSLKTRENVFVLPPQWIPDPIVWENYLRIWEAGPILTGIINSSIVSLTVITIGTITSSFAAYGFSKMKIPGKNAIFLGLLAGIMIPFPALMIPTFMLFSRIGWVDTLLPLIVPGLFGNLMMVFFLRQYLMSIPDSLIEAAVIDGASHPQIFGRIVLPLIRPAIAAQVILWFMGTWNDYLGPIIYLNSENVHTLQLVIANFNATYAVQTDFPLIMAASIVSLIPVLAVFLIFQRQIIESIALTGNKG